MNITKYETRINSDGLAVCEKSWMKRMDVGVSNRYFTYPDVVYELCKALSLDSYAEEHAFLLIFDIKMRFKSFIEIGIGSNNTCVLDKRGIAQKLLLLNAATFIIIHNHPSGDPTPSEIDIEVSNEISDIGKLLGIPMKDSIILGNDNYLSMKNDCFIV